MLKYTYDDINIIDNERVSDAFGKECYYGYSVKEVLDNALNDRCKFILRQVDMDNPEPFGDTSNRWYPFMIVKKEESKFQYVPFKSMKELVDRYSEVMRAVDYDSFEDGILQWGMWLKNVDDNGRPVYILVCEIKDEGVKLDEHGWFNWEELFSKGFLFPNDTPCGKLVEVKHE